MRVNHWLAAILIFTSISNVSAQLTLATQQPIHDFERARELFGKQRYAAAQTLFTQYVATSNNSNLRADAQYYVALCAARLMQDDAEYLVKKYRVNNPTNTGLKQSHFELGKYYFLQKNYHSALFEFIEIDPYILEPEEATEYFFMTGYSQFHEGNLNEARPYFKEIIQTEGPYYYLSNYFNSYIAFENDDFDEALEGFLKIEKQAEFENLMPVYITQVYALTKDYDKVIEYGDKAVAKKGVERKHVIELLLAQAHFKKENFEKSFALYNSYETKRDLSSEDNYQFAFAAYSTKNYKQALKIFESLIIEEDSLGQNIAYLMADCYLKNDQKLEARNSFSFVKSLDFDARLKEDALYNYAKISYELKFNKEAVKSFDEFIKKYPDSKYIDEAKENFTRILLQSNNYQQAFDIIEKMDRPTAKINMAYQRLAYNIGLQLYDIKDYKNARVYLNKSLKRPVAPIFKSLAYYWIGETLYKEERYEEAIESFKNFLFVPESSNTPIKASAQYNLGYCYFKLEQYKEALYYFQEYYNYKNPIYTKQFNSDANLRSADCYFALGLYDKAIANYDKVIETNYTDVDYAMYQKGMIKGLQGKPNEKIEILTNLTRQFKSSGYVDDALFEAANEKLIGGNFKQALREFEYLNQDFANNIYYKVVLLKIGLIYYNLDESEKALKVFSEVISEFPSSDESREALTLIKNIYVDLGQADKFLALIDTMTNVKYTETAKDSTLFNSSLSTLKRGDCVATAKSFQTYLNNFEYGIFSQQAYYYMADCYKKLDSFEAALNAYDVLIARKPNPYYENALTKASIYCFERDSFKRAIPYLKIREEVSNNRIVLLEIYEGLAKAYLETNDCKNAEVYLNRIRTFEEANKEVIERADYTVARCALAEKNYTQALKLFARVAENNTGKLGAESQYLVAYIYYLKEEYDSSTTAILNLKDNYSSFEYFVAKSFILMADNFSKMGDNFNAKSTLQSIIENYEGADLKTVAQQKLDAILFKEKQEAEKKKEIQEQQNDTLEYNEKK